MSHITFRDSIVVVLETGRTTVRAGLGLHDLLKTPTIEIQARVGLRNHASTSKLNGRSEFNSEENVSSGFVTPSNGASAISRQTSTQTASHVSEYLVGAQLDNALAAGEDISLFWPFSQGTISDMLQAEAIWKHVLFQLLGIKRTQNESPCLLTLPHGLSHNEYERVCQIFFERFNVAALSILDRPLAQMYAANTLTGVIVDIGDYRIDVTPINDCFVQHNACTVAKVGLRHCELYVAHLLKSNQSIMNTLSPPEAPIDSAVLDEMLVSFVRQLWNEGHIKVPLGEAVLELEEEGVTNIAAVLVAGKEKAVIESGMKKRNIAKATAAEQARAKEIEALDLITVQFGEHSLTVGRERHRFCEPLFDPVLLEGIEGIPEIDVQLHEVLPIHDACGLAVARVDLGSRPTIYNGLFVTGDCTSTVKGIGLALQSRLAPYITSHPDMPTDVQPRSIRVLHVPEYFAEYREQGDRYAAFLGASIVAKVTFSDAYGKNFVSKSDYSVHGPRAILDMSPTVL